jgi:hypothetical protein
VNRMLPRQLIATQPVEPLDHVIDNGPADAIPDAAARLCTITR